MNGKQVGDRVKITRGEHAGATGTVTAVDPGNPPHEASMLLVSLGDRVREVAVPRGWTLKQKGERAVAR